MTVNEKLNHVCDRVCSLIDSVDITPLSQAGEKSARWVSRMLNLRPRYFFTKENKLRLRYVASGFCLLFASSIFALTLSNHSTSSSISTASLKILHDKTHAQANLSEAQRSITDMLDGRLYGKLSLASAALNAIPEPKDVSVKIKSGDSLGKVLEDKGLSGEEATAVIEAVSDHFDPRDLKAGQEIAMHFSPDTGGMYRFDAMKLEIDPIRTVLVERAEDTFKADLQEKEVTQMVHAKSAKIQSSVFGSAAKAGIPKAVVADVIRVYSSNVDFQRDIREGDTLEVMYDSFETEDGYVSKTGNVQYAKLTIGGVEKPIYRFETASGYTDYFDREGRSIKNTLMRTPVDGARMSSGFGMRRHPVLGYNKMHKGMDFAAPTGTPIYAAGDGVVEKASRFSSYGNYVLIRHNSSLKTAYAHLSKFKSGLRPGSRVKQGQVIGYVGTTGRSTGPHLHYEVHLNGKQVNPHSVNLPTGEELKGKELANFKAMIKKIDQDYAARLNGMKYASAKTVEPKRKIN